jgi:hypothetical protein
LCLGKIEQAPAVVLVGGVVRILKTLVTGVGLAASIAAVAGPLQGPFCVVVTGVGRDCKYYDEASCARAAIERQGACIDRSTGFGIGPNKGARYCLIGAGEAKCSYYDAASCAKAIQDFGGTCVERFRNHPGS